MAAACCRGVEIRATVEISLVAKDRADPQDGCDTGDPKDRGLRLKFRPFAKATFRGKCLTTPRLRTILEDVLEYPEFVRALLSCV